MSIQSQSSSKTEGPIFKEIQIQTDLKQKFFKARDRCRDLKNHFSNLIEHYDISPNGIKLRMNNKNMHDPANREQIVDLDDAINSLNLVSIYVDVSQ